MFSFPLPSLRCLLLLAATATASTVYQNWVANVQHQRIGNGWPSISA